MKQGSKWVFSVLFLYYTGQKSAVCWFVPLSFVQVCPFVEEFFHPLMKAVFSVCLAHMIQTFINKRWEKHYIERFWYKIYDFVMTYNLALIMGDTLWPLAATVYLAAIVLTVCLVVVDKILVEYYFPEQYFLEPGHSASGGATLGGRVAWRCLKGSLKICTDMSFTDLRNELRRYKTQIKRSSTCLARTARSFMASPLMRKASEAWTIWRGSQNSEASPTNATSSETMTSQNTPRVPLVSTPRPASSRSGRVSKKSEIEKSAFDFGVSRTRSGRVFSY